MCFKTTLNYVFVCWIKWYFCPLKNKCISLSSISQIFLFYQTTHQIYSISHLFLSSHTLSHLFLSSQFLFQSKHTLNNYYIWSINVSRYINYSMNLKICFLFINVTGESNNLKICWKVNKTWRKFNYYKIRTHDWTIQGRLL